MVLKGSILIRNNDANDDDDEVEEDKKKEILPQLTRSQLIQQRSRSFSETMGILFYNNNDNDSTEQQRVSIRRDVRDLVIGILVLALGWYGPRYMVQPIVSLLLRNGQDEGEATEPPYQMTKEGDVILDFSLNYPLVDPPMIPCTFWTITCFLSFVLYCVLSCCIWR
jgi:hypothetical protein